MSIADAVDYIMNATMPLDRRQSLQELFDEYERLQQEVKRLTNELALTRIPVTIDAVEREEHRQEIERLRKIETAAKRLRTQRNRYDTLGCNWTCRKMLDLFNSLDEV